MSDAEAIMWAVEKDPALRSDFCNLTILDRRPSDARLRMTLTRALAAIPRLRQRVIGAPLRLVPPEFADDPTLDLDAHIRVVAVPSPGDERAFLELCGAIAERPLDRARPLWEFTLIDGLPDGRSALLQKVHHTLFDGEAGMRLSLALVDLERDPVPDAHAPLTAPDDAAAHDALADGEPRRDTPGTVTANALRDATARNVGAVRNALGAAGRVLAQPQALPGRAADAVRFVSSLQRQALVTDGAHSDVMRDRSLRRYFTTHHLSLPEIHGAATRLGGSINDAFVTGLVSALGRYHERFDSQANELRVAMPVSTRRRGDREATNAFTPARVLVPIEPAYDVGALFKDVHDRLETAKTETALSAAQGLAGVASALPTAVLVAVTKTQTRTVDFAASNLRGSPVPLYLAGSQIIASYPFGPRTGSALNVTMMSYCDELHLGCNVDPAAIVDPDGFMQDLDDAYTSLVTHA